MSDEEAALFGLKSGDIVAAKKTGAREITFGNILVRTGSGHALELHLDTDEANAAAAIGDKIGIKIDGGIKDAATASALLAAGANRLGCSVSVKIVTG